MTQLITEERRVLTRSLNTVPTFTIYFNFTSVSGWIVTYSKEIVWELYAFNDGTLRGLT